MYMSPTKSFGSTLMYSVNFNEGIKSIRNDRKYWRIKRKEKRAMTPKSEWAIDKLPQHEHLVTFITAKGSLHNSYQLAVRHAIFITISLFFHLFNFMCYCCKKLEYS